MLDQDTQTIELDEVEDVENHSHEYRELLSVIKNKKGDKPIDCGKYHRLMKLTWMPKSIENIHDIEDEEVLYLFYSECVSRAVGKRKWNKCSQVKNMGKFVTCSDEALAMILLENNLPKWMDEVRHDKILSRAEKRKTLYTEEDKTKGWTNRGLRRFMELCQACHNRRNGTDEKRAKWIEIEKFIMKREIQWNELSNRKRKRAEENNDLNTREDDNEESDEEVDIENFMLAMACGKTIGNEEN